MKRPTEAQKQAERVVLNAKLGLLIGEIQTAVNQQFDYNLTENLDRNFLKLEECADHAIKNGLVSAIGDLVKWDIEETVKFAVDVLSNSNCHAEAHLLHNYEKKQFACQTKL